MQKKKVILITSGLAALAVMVVASPTLAATVNSPVQRGMMARFGNFKAALPHFSKGAMIKPAAFGKISAINGSIITITGINNSTLTIDATNAKITSGGGPKAQTIALANLTVGETILATGTVSGTNVTAKTITVVNTMATPAAMPGARGKISAINGSILTVTGNNNTTYEVDATNAKITKGRGTSVQTLAIGDLTVGEMIFATGTVNGTNVAATAILVINNLQPGNFGHNRGVNGKVTAVNGSSFTIQSNRRLPKAQNTLPVSFTVNTTATTVFKKDGKTAGLSDVAAGETVIVSGSVDATSSVVSANSVNIITKQVSPVKKIGTSLIGKFLNLFKKK